MFVVQWPKASIRFRIAGVTTGSCELLNMGAGNQSPTEEQQVLLSAEPSPQPLFFFIFN